ncbi:MAG: Bug family tripartite tricarboxylate transporter substrate binding protein [Xanthobacteraceae bacterium]
MRRRAFMIFVVGAALAWTAAPVAAQDYPTRPITLIVPFPAGGGNDVLARMMAEKLGVALGQQIVIDNRAGAGGTIATRAAAAARPDGYTLMLGYTGTLSVNPTLYPNAGYDPRKDFAPIGLIASQGSVLCVHPSLPATSVAELIALAKARPGEINYGTTPGTVGHITSELFARTAGIELTFIPYKGTAPAVSDLLGGHIKMMFAPPLTNMSHVRAGTLRALAVTTPARSRLLPEVPTVAEASLPGFSAAVRYGLLAPAGTPRAIIDRLNRELQSALAAEDVQERLRREGADPVESSPDDYAAEIDREEAKWGALVRKLGLKME